MGLRSLDRLTVRQSVSLTMLSDASKLDQDLACGPHRHVNSEVETFSTTFRVFCQRSKIHPIDRIKKRLH